MEQSVDVATAYAVYSGGTPKTVAFYADGKNLVRQVFYDASPGKCVSLCSKNITGYYNQSTICNCGYNDGARTSCSAVAAMFTMLRSPNKWTVWIGSRFPLTICYARSGQFFISAPQSSKGCYGESGSLLA